MKTVTRDLAAFVAAARLADVPADVQRHAKRTLLNFFGCALGGARHPSVESMVRGRGPWSGRRIATAIGRDEMFDPLLAALINGMSSAVYSFDDTHAEALVHPGGPVASSLLALSQVRGATGREFLLAFIVGAEIVCRLSKSISTPPAHARKEWVQTGVCAGIGAAAGGARLLETSEREAVSAMGIAAARASGLRALSRSMCFSYMAGTAAETGAASALLAQAGMSGPDEALGGEEGFCASFSDGAHIDYLVADLGKRYELAANTFKPYPCGVVIHPVVDAALALAAQIDPSEIEDILVEVHPTTKTLTDSPDPVDQFEAQSSLQHWTACALLDREAGIVQSSDARVFSTSVIEMRHRVRIKPNPELERSGARMTVRLSSGRELSQSIRQCRGSSERPLSDADLEAKYLSQALPILGEAKARRLADACWDVDRLQSATELLDIVGGSEA